MGNLLRLVLLAFALTRAAALFPLDSLHHPTPSSLLRCRLQCRHLGFLSSRLLLPRSTASYAGQVCRHENRFRHGRSPLLGLRAQVNPLNPPPPREERVGAEQAQGINWDALRKQFKLFQKMALPYFREEKSARMLIFIVICFSLLNSWVSVGFSFLSRDFWSALNAKDADTFYPTLGKFAIALTGGAPIAVLYRFYREKLSLQWREWMTLRILDMWEANRRSQPQTPNPKPQILNSTP
jgi:hypothetical protein